MEVESTHNPDAQEEEKFVPKGAIAFFIGLLGLGAIIWFSIYFIMLARA